MVRTGKKFIDELLPKTKKDVGAEIAQRTQQQPSQPVTSFKQTGSKPISKPVPDFFTTESRDVLKTHEIDEKVFLEKLKPSQQGEKGISASAPQYSKEKIDEFNAQLAAQRSQEASALLNQMQGRQFEGATTPSGIDISQAAGTAATGVIGGLVTGAIGGATAGAIGGPIGAGGGAAIGAVGGLIMGIRSNIKSQISQDISSKSIELSKGERNLRFVISDLNQGGNPTTDVTLFYENVGAIQQAYSQLKLDTQQNLAKFTGNDGTPELTRYKIFFEQTLPLLERELAQGVANPNPSRILVDNSEVEFEQ